MTLRQMACVAFSRFGKRLRVTLADDIPDEVEPDNFYVVGDLRRPQYAVFKCPCGCGRDIELNLNPSSRPCWDLSFHVFGTVSLAPSVGRKGGCRSHFFLKHSKVIWCTDD